MNRWRERERERERENLFSESAHVHGLTAGFSKLLEGRLARRRTISLKLTSAHVLHHTNKSSTFVLVNVAR